MKVVGRKIEGSMSSGFDLEAVAKDVAAPLIRKFSEM